MTASTLSASLGLIAGVWLFFQLIPGDTRSTGQWVLRVLSTGLTGVLTLISILLLAASGRFAFAGGAKAPIIVAYLIWGVACLAFSLELASAPLPLRACLGLAPILIHLALLMPPGVSRALLVAALVLEVLSPVALTVYNIYIEPVIASKEVNGWRQYEMEAARQYEIDLRNDLQRVTADANLEAFFYYTRSSRQSGSAKDLVIADAIAKKPNLEAELVAALHGDPDARRGARSFLERPAIPRTDALAVAVRESILLDVNDLTGMAADDRDLETRRDQAAAAAVAMARSFPAHAATIRPALERLHAVTGKPNTPRRGFVSGREELARFLRR
jgi:hypothetical protein